MAPLKHLDSIAALRKEYQLSALEEATAGDDPFAFFGKWFLEAQSAEVHEVNAMTLATADEKGRPHARTVLLKGLDEKGFLFFTNYNSSKGAELERNPQVALVFFWRELERQVRVEGTVERLTQEENDTYFHSRPEGSRLGAWASPQSQVIAERGILESNYRIYTEKFAGEEIPRPPYWGGYRVLPDTIEFWQGRSSRLHDRILFTLQEDDCWHRSRLAP